MAWNDSYSILIARSLCQLQMSIPDVNSRCQFQMPIPDVNSGLTVESSSGQLSIPEPVPMLIFPGFKQFHLHNRYPTSYSRSSQYSRKPVALIERERKIMVDVVLARMCAPTQFSLSP
ncbi:hypothetical protein EVAR_35834_1 [Eumeta japonica]|uniref:Uncharacterized protein n=1 Tax=Eumeta variegata TaxID=151549 RepID=A0A4C1WZT9_EUMVA|nr:hypothetical protein EVAR_35834_1 [Eumeta japonica]